MKYIYIYNVIINFIFLIMNISRNNQLTFTKCFSDIPPGNNWTLYVCDGVLPQGNKTCSNPAVILTDISIIGRIFIEPSRTSTVISTSITDSISEVPTTTGIIIITINHTYSMYICM